MNNAAHMPNAAKWGAIMGFGLIVMGLVFYLTGSIDLETGQSGTMSTILSYVISIGALVLGIKAYKAINQGELTVGQAIIQGLLIALVGGIINAIYTYVFFTMLEPDILVNMKDQVMEQSGGDAEQVEGIMDAFMSPGIMSAMVVVMKLFLGLFVGLITGLIMKSERPHNDVL